MTVKIAEDAHENVEEQEMDSSKVRIKFES